MIGELPYLTTAPDGIKGRLYDVFELTVVLVSFLDAWLFSAENAYLGALVVMRSLRVFVSIKGLQIFFPVQVVFKAVGATIEATSSFIQLLLLLIFVFALLGMHLFGGKMPEYSIVSQRSDAPSSFILQSRANFDNVVQSMLTVLQVLTLEWVGICYPLMSETSLWVSLYFFALILLGNLLMLNLFLAVLIDAIALNEQKLNQTESQQALAAGALKTIHAMTPTMAEKERADLIKSCQAISARLARLGYEDRFLGADMYRGGEAGANPEEEPESPSARESHLLDRLRSGEISYAAYKTEQRAVAHDALTERSLTDAERCVHVRLRSVFGYFDGTYRIFTYRIFTYRIFSEWGWRDRS